jgi:hypothetical protein
METVRISVARALVELKTLDKRIVKLISEIKILDLSIGHKLKTNLTKEEFEKLAKSDFQSLKDLMFRRNKMKSEIVKSNATTIVKIAGKEMTVAQAIERKASIEIDKALTKRFRETLHMYTVEAEKLNAQAQVRLDKLLEAAVSKDSSKVKSDECEAVSKPFMERNQAVIIDPLSIRLVIKELEDQITEFEKEVDITLSESNARTEIEV